MASFRCRFAVAQRNRQSVDRPDSGEDDLEKGNPSRQRWLRRIDDKTLHGQLGHADEEDGAGNLQE